jgi:hypothetical protein
MLGEDIWPKREMVTGDWRRLHNEELYDSYSSRNIIWVIKSRGDGSDIWHMWGKIEPHTGS